MSNATFPTVHVSEVSRYATNTSNLPYMAQLAAMDKYGEDRVRAMVDSFYIVVTDQSEAGTTKPFDPASSSFALKISDLESIAE
jgi:hypothetical protein